MSKPSQVEQAIGSSVAFHMDPHTFTDVVRDTQQYFTMHNTPEFIVHRIMLSRIRVLIMDATDVDLWS